MPAEIPIILPFSLIGGLMAYLITYEEMRHHFERPVAVAAAARTGVVTLLVLAALSLAAARVLLLSQASAGY